MMYRFIRFITKVSFAIGKIDETERDRRMSRIDEMERLENEEDE